MRLLVTVPWGERLGGAESMLQSLAEQVGPAGHELEFVFFQDGPWAAELAAAGFPVTALPFGRLRDLPRTLANVVRLARLLRRRKPDLIVNWSAKTQVYGAPAALLAGMHRRVVWWQHMITEGHWLDRAATLLPARAICCCSHTAAEAQQRLRPRRSTPVVAPGTAPPAPGEPAAALELPSDVPVVGLVGRLQPWKGQDRLLQAQALLAARGQQLHLLIVGGDAYGFSSEYAAGLSELARRLGLEQQVTMTGQVADAGPYIQLMDVLVNASDPEPFGIVLLEGMARGVAVVAVDSGGPAEFVEQGRTGALAASGEPEALAEALAPLLASAQLRGRLGGEGRVRFEQEFTDAAMCRRLLVVLEQLRG